MLWKIKGIMPNDGRHDPKPKEFQQTAEWCEGCKTEFELGETEYVEEYRKWLCKTCLKQTKKRR